MLKVSTLSILIPLIFTGCDLKDDPELVGQLEEIKTKVEAAESELAGVEAEIKEIRTTDSSEELGRLKLEITELAAQKAALEDDIQELGESQKKAAADLDAYQRKYPLR